MHGQTFKLERVGSFPDQHPHRLVGPGFKIKMIKQMRGSIFSFLKDCWWKILANEISEYRSNYLILDADIIILKNACVNLVSSIYSLYLNLNL